MCYLQEHITDRDSIRASEEEKQKAEEERRKLFVSAKEKMMKLRKDREMELLRYKPERSKDKSSFKSCIIAQPLFDPEKPRSTEKAS